MTRVGMNPARTKKTDYRPARVTVAVLVHIPYLAGYYEARWPVLQATLASLQQNTLSPHDILVFDNGSCAQVNGYLDNLQSEGHIDFLLRSKRNLGKIGAYRFIFQAAPGELVAYTDDDFFFEPGWLEAQLSIMDTYPNVGMVSGYVIPSFFTTERMSANLDFAENQPGVRLLKPAEIPDSWVADWAESTGRDPDEAVARGKSFIPAAIEYKGAKAYAAANHDQFLTRKEVMLKVLPKEWSGNLMGQMIEIDEVINSRGYLRLATADRTCQHIGNILSADIAERVKNLEHSPSGLALTTNSGHPAPTWFKRFLRWRPVRFVLLGLYSHLFHWINPD